MEPFLNPAQTVADLRNAASFLARNNWGQGQHYRQDTGAFCAFGAVRHVVGGLTVDPNEPYGFVCHDETHVVHMLHGTDSDEYRRAVILRDRASNAARAFYRFFGQDIVLYNDRDGRTKEQVIRALEIVADGLEGDPSRA